MSNSCFGDGMCAHTLLLQSHHERIQHNIKSLRPNGTSYGWAYTVALSQLLYFGLAPVLPLAVSLNVNYDG